MCIIIHITPTIGKGKARHTCRVYTCSTKGNVSFCHHLASVVCRSLTFHIFLSYYNGEVFRNEPIRNKNCLWWPCLLTDRDEMSNLYRGPSIHASYQISVHLAKRFRRRFKKNRPIRKKNCLWWPCLLIDWDKMSNL
jgi:hypothetical protein